MHGFWRHPALPIGVVLLVLGMGNWVASRSKIAEYARRTSELTPIEPTASLEGFKRLTPRTNTTLLQRLHHRFSEYGVAEARRDFYIVVQSGGRLIAVVGLLLIGGGLLQRWRERRLRRMAAATLLPSPRPVVGA